jgi:co-chaperonin GroES (HSP10)
MNKSGLHPSGEAILLRLYDPETRSSAIYVPPMVSARQAMIETRGIILEIGSQAWLDEDEPRHEIGDKVLIGRYSGTIMEGPRDKIKYRMVNARDIYCGIDDGLEVTEDMFESQLKAEQQELARQVRAQQGITSRSPR